MPDVIEGGRSGARRRLWRGGAVAIAAIVLLIWAILRAAGPPPSAERPGAVPGGPSPHTSTPTEPAAVTPLPDALSGAPLPAAGFSPLLIPTRPPRLVDPINATSETIKDLLADPDGGYEVTDLGGGSFVVTFRPAFSGHCTPPATTAYLVDAASASATFIAAGDMIAHGSDGESILVSTRLDPAGESAAQRFDLAGRRIGRPVALPPGHRLVRETVGGWLLSGTEGSEVWDPATGEVHYRYSQFIAAGSGWLVHYTSPSSVVVVDLATGSMRRVPLPAGLTAIDDGALSPDARYVAVAATDGAGTARTVGVLDLTSDAWMMMPGMPIQAVFEAGAVAISWSGQVLTAVTATPPSAVAWKPGTPIAHQLPV